VAKLPTRPKSRRGIVLALSAGVAAVALVGFAVVYFVLLPTSSPKPFKLSPSAVAAASSSTGSLGGRWQIAGGSQAGYRVREQLAFLPAQSDAVGRTSAITGAATITESKGVARITAASFSVAVNTLTSDRSMRDEKLHSVGLESDQYPTATFALATPVMLPASVLTGHPAHISVKGVLGLHGVSRNESVPLEMGLSGSTLQAAGSLSFPWSDFNMTAPSIGGFVTVTGTATMEFDLLMHRG
jgi:hypothetical protein